ncbi:MAG: dihydroorotase [Bacteroidales bacterium]|jgi:dihydroorotase
MTQNNSTHRQTIIKNALIINEGTSFKGYVLIKDDIIADIGKGDYNGEHTSNDIVIDAEDKWLIPGIIDTHVHFREPGLTHKADIKSESMAAIAGGVTSYMEMPNTLPNTVSLEQVNEKNKIASSNSYANYSFYIAATNSNVDELLSLDKSDICGIKIFLGSSTGGMLMDNQSELDKLFNNAKVPIVAHCEDESIIKQNEKNYKEKFGDDFPIKFHSEIRSAEACYKSTEQAVKLAKKYNTRLHIAHLSTAKELQLFSDNKDSKAKNITVEVCPQHLLFSDEDYSTFGTKLKVNPAIKTQNDKIGLLQGVISGRVDTIATDHAPHTLAEKDNSYFKAPSGMPMVQHGFVALLQLVHAGKLSVELLVDKMCHSPALCFNIYKRGFIRKGYFADLVIVAPYTSSVITKDNTYYKCGWSLFESTEMKGKIEKTIVNGNISFDDGFFSEEVYSSQLKFDR